MNNTEENRLQYFSLYEGQKVARHAMSDELLEVGTEIQLDNIDWLELSKKQLKRFKYSQSDVVKWGWVVIV